MSKRSILYIQYTNPTAYPPLEHSAILLSRRGWDIFFSGIKWHDSGDFEFCNELDAQIFFTSAPSSGWSRKALLFIFTLNSVIYALKVNPSWVYVSDPSASPAGLVLSALGFKVLYHEHDTPTENANGIKDKIILACRTYLARLCKFIIVPQVTRRTLFIESTRTVKPVYRVWNCPRSDEVTAHTYRQRQVSQPLGIYYHGSITNRRVPLTLIEAAGVSSCPVLIRVVGYETTGSKGTSRLLQQAASKFSNLTLELPGPQPNRQCLFALMDQMHLGWIAYDEQGAAADADVNLLHLAGASNKAFDYLAAGMAILINNSSEWLELFGSTGTCIPCNVADIEKLSKSIRWAYENPVDLARMGRQGGNLIRSELNYANQFRTVLSLLER